ncbi:hypothetical protein SAMN03159339_6899 [Variovorax sp. 770b2]|nr:hypothetical protein SAMN03159339_6899 [Variovorax sp. 770b2]
MLPVLILIGIIVVLFIVVNLSAGSDEYKARRYLADKYDEERRSRGR